MNEERWILAELIRRLLEEEKRVYTEKEWHASWNFEEICTLLEQIRMEAVLDVDDDAGVE